MASQDRSGPARPASSLLCGLRWGSKPTDQGANLGLISPLGGQSSISGFRSLIGLPHMSEYATFLLPICYNGAEAIRSWPGKAAFNLARGIFTQQIGYEHFAQLMKNPHDNPPPPFTPQCQPFTPKHFILL